MSGNVNKYWESTSLEDMSDSEWEGICDGCAKCCLHKLIDDDQAHDALPTAHIQDDETIHYTSVACHLLDTKACSCTKYDQRTKLVPSCVKLTKANLQDIFFMPPSCSYRRLHEGRGLPSWHPLLNKNKKSAMHKAGMSVRGKTLSDKHIDTEQFEDYIALWPLNDLD